MIQGSPEWFAARLGKVTSSRVCDVIAKTKTGWGASRANYMAQLIAERLTGVAQESYTNAAMEWGKATEAEARDAYAFRQDVDVEEVGFIGHPRIAMSGASPDGRVNVTSGLAGLVEIKCPNTATHLDTLLSQTVPEKYRTQMLWQMACSGASWCDFVSYDPRLPEGMRLFVKRVQWEPDEIKRLEEHVSDFLSELDDKLAKLTGTYNVRLASQLAASVEAA